MTYCALRIDHEELAMRLPDTATVVADALSALDRRDTQAAETKPCEPHSEVRQRAMRHKYLQYFDAHAAGRDRTLPVQLRQLAEHELWLRNRLAHSGGYFEHGVCTLTVKKEDPPRFQFATSFDSLQFHIRQETLDSFAYKHGARQIDTLSWPHGARDQTLSQLASALLPALGEVRIAPPSRSWSHRKT